MMDQQLKHYGDIAAVGSGAGWTLAQWSDFAGQMTPILSALFLLASLLWLGWRMLDRVRFGPNRGRDDG